MIDYTEDWLFKLLLQVRGSLALRACIFAIPCAALSTLLIWLDEWTPDLRDRWGLLQLGKSQLWTATTAALGMLLAFRTNRAMARFWEGTGLLHQMRGEWFDSISCCVTFSHGALGTKRKEVKRFRHTIVRLMSLCHGSALEEIAGCAEEEKFETIDCLGLDNTTLCYMKSCKEELKFNRVEVLLHLTQLLITQALEDGVLKVPPPILSRVYQTLSRGFVNLLNAKKIADTKFPFPYAQLIAMLLFMHVLLTPIMISCLIPNKVWAPIFTFIPIFGMFSVNFIGIELENPFGVDENDLPLEHFQSEMNKCLLMLLHDGSDIIADVSESRCIMKYKLLAASMEPESSHLTQIRATVRRPSITNCTEVTNIHEEGKARLSAMFESEGTVRSENDGSGSADVVEKKVLEFTRSDLSLTEASDALHRTASEISMHADRAVGGATAITRNGFDKTCSAQAITWITTPRASDDNCNIDHVSEARSEFRRFSPVQHTSIEPTLLSERSVRSTVMQSVRCHPSTPR